MGLAQPALHLPLFHIVYRVHARGHSDDVVGHPLPLRGDDHGGPRHCGRGGRHPVHRRILAVHDRPTGRQELLDGDVVHAHRSFEHDRACGGVCAHDRRRDHRRPCDIAHEQRAPDICIICALRVLLPVLRGELLPDVARPPRRRRLRREPGRLAGPIGGPGDFLLRGHQHVPARLRARRMGGGRDLGVRRALRRGLHEGGLPCRHDFVVVDHRPSVADPLGRHLR
mmetsp:Transcript_82581/g.252365  ORF Transcript_82581/g.252365 Transcript_82581/m.252365 type:complete len:226 (+) Transcript_82581:739-1416(+)